MPPPSKSTTKPMFSSMSEGGAPLSNNLWIGNLSPEVSDADLLALFEKHGPVDSITNYSSRGYAFVYFKKTEDAKSAKEKIQGSIVHGNSVKIEFAKPAKPCKSLWVAGIGQSVSKEELEQEFMKFGKIQEFKFLRDRGTAYIDYVKLEDASQALKIMNGKRMGDDQIRVDFLRSQPARKEQGLDYRDGHFSSRNIGTPDARWIPQDSIKAYNELAYAGAKRHQFLAPGVRNGEGQPSKVLWISYPPTVPIDEDMLHNAMILFGEIERIKTFEDRNYAFVQFRSVDEARLAKEGLQGKLFNDPRISIEYSNSELTPSKDYFGKYPGIKGPGPDMQLNDVPLRQGQIDIFTHNRPILPLPGVHGTDIPLRPVGPQGSFETGYPNSEFSDLSSIHKPGGPNWRSSPAQSMISSPSGGLAPPKRSSGPWDIFDASQLQRESKRSRVDGNLPAYDVPYPSKRIDDRGFPLDDPHLSPADARVAAGLGSRHPNPDYVWKGVIAKGGSPICRARCVPIEGIISEIPDVVNCSARTGLDMLTKHYSDAIGFSIVYFLPDSEADFASYTEFLRYLGAKNRAGVAKFDDGTTLFLVPPSDFLTRVLNVAGPERLYGVVLEFPQPASSSAAIQPQYGDVQHQASQTGSNMMTQEENALQVGYNRVLHDGVKPPLKTLSPPSSSVPINNGAVSQPPVSLTPELIATLASLLPSNGKLVGSENPLVQSTTSTMGGVHVAPLPGKGHTQVWTNERQMPEQSGHVVQQLSNHCHNQAQFVPQNQAYAPSFSTPNFPSQGDYSQMQERAYNLPQQVSVSSRPVPSAVFSHGQVSVASQVDQQHPLAVSHDPVRLYGSSMFQQATYPISSANEINGSQMAQLSTGQLPSGTDPSNQVLQLPTPLHGTGQETSETEEEKNRRYQTTLLFAANLLSKVKQPGNHAAHGPGS